MACIVENGDVQTFWSLEWSDGTIDTFEFKSTEPAPEPSTLLLLCTGMLGVGATGRRKYFSRVFSNARTRGVSAAARTLFPSPCAAGVGSVVKGTDAFSTSPP